jgi:hypothetical protein
LAAFAKVFLMLSIVFFSVSVYAEDSRGSMPDELFDGMVKFKINSGDYFDALTMMDERYIQTYPSDYTSALYGYSMFSEARQRLAENIKKKSQLDG